MLIFKKREAGQGIRFMIRNTNKKKAGRLCCRTASDTKERMFSFWSSNLFSNPRHIQVRVWVLNSEGKALLLKTTHKLVQSKGGGSHKSKPSSVKTNCGYERQGSCPGMTASTTSFHTQSNEEAVVAADPGSGSCSGSCQKLAQHGQNSSLSLYFTPSCIAKGPLAEPASHSQTFLWSDLPLPGICLTWDKMPHNSVTAI